MEKRNKLNKYFLALITVLFFVNFSFVEAQVSNAKAPMLKLNNGIEMPQLGLGTYTVPNEACKEACLVAFKNGYRHIDTAHAYRNESGVGQAVKESGIPREEIWITSKLWPSEYGEGPTMEAIDKMLARLQTTYIDLLYVHQPVGDFIGAWKDMEKAVAQGKVRALGISNFDDSDEVFHAIVDNMKIKPAVLQIECHPYAQRIKIREKVKPYGIAIECWYPLGHGSKELLSDPVIGKIAKAHNKSIAQIILRWHIQEGFSVIPGATNPDYIKENISIFDFKLSDAEMATMRGLNKEQRFFNMTLEQKQGFVNMKFDDETPSTQNTQKESTSDIEKEIIQLSKDKWQWMSDKNVNELTKLFHEKAEFVHMGGNWDTQRELEIIKSGGIWYKKADVHNVSVNIIDNTAILLNRIDLLAVVGGNEVTNPFIVTEVYIKQGNTWKLGSLSFTRVMTRGNE